MVFVRVTVMVLTRDGVGHTAWAPEGRSQVGPKGCKLEFGARRAPRLLVVYEINEYSIKLNTANNNWRNHILNRFCCKIRTFVWIVHTWLGLWCPKHLYANRRFAFLEILSNHVILWLVLKWFLIEADLWQMDEMRKLFFCELLDALHLPTLILSRS